MIQEKCCMMGKEVRFQEKKNFSDFINLHIYLQETTQKLWIHKLENLIEKSEIVMY